MTKIIFLRLLYVLFIIISNHCLIYGQSVPIITHSTNSSGQIQLTVNSTSQNYYVLRVRHHKDSLFELSTSITLGKANTTIITEPLGGYPLEHYEVLEHLITSPIDSDKDGIDDMTEYQDRPNRNPLNAAQSININDGVIMVDNFETFKRLSIKKDFVQWSEFLNGKAFVKFIIVDFNTVPKIFFMNTSYHNLHEDFARAINIDYLGNHVKKGQIIYHPKSISSNGSLGTFAFNYSNGHAQDFNVVQKTHELIATNMPFLKNNLSYFITENNEAQYYQDSISFKNSRVPLLFEADIYSGLDYWGLNEAEGFGFFHKVALEELPGSKDIVLYESLPNSLPHVGGIITSAIQTPLSHVNLRAIQNNIPNAFIRDPLAIDSINNLLNDYIYFKVTSDYFFIRKATLKEVNEWYEHLRPKEEQIPPLNLDYTSILPLNEITFSMSDGFGAKSANMATMQTFGFPDKTIANGFGVPFYFYQEFMKYNNFFEEVDVMMNFPKFNTDRTVRERLLKDFRKKIKSASMPNWMLSQLDAMHSSFPQGTSIRCRSSSNNEDLANFNGAGLYDSKTQHPDEGHISKSIKQVYASLWNLRAFEERDFYRINHFKASMGVLCHPNYSNEKANGVGVSTDPIYNTENTFYLNTQIGEDLITNPSNKSRPEEILLDNGINNGNGYTIVTRSNLISDDTIIMNRQYLTQMRHYLSIIHDTFKLLYNAVNNNSFAMDIEYKITLNNQLIIKQARPWVSYIPQKNESCNNDFFDLHIFPNPAQKYITLQCNHNLDKVIIINTLGEVLQKTNVYDTNQSNIKLSIETIPSGMYFLTGVSKGNALSKTKTFIKN